MSTVEENRAGVPWIPALAAVSLSQIASAYLTRLIPVLAPLLTVEYGVSDTWVGYLAALTMMGSILFLVIGGPLIRRLGPLRTLQLGLVASAIALVLLGVPVVAALVPAAFLLGIGYGPSTPAGNEVLQQYAPPAHRSLMFSVKQAAVPAGGIVAGLVLPPVVESYGLYGALAFSCLVVMATFISVQPMRATVDRVRDGSVGIGPRELLAFSNISDPLRTLFTDRRILSVCLVGMCLAMGQGVWFSFLVAYSVFDLDLTFAQAGLLLAIMQASGVVGRVVIGSLADRLGSSRRLLQILSVASALTSLALALTSPAWDFTVLCGLALTAGVTVSSWNGVQLAEIASLAPAGKVAVTSAGATIVTFIGYVAAPLLFSLLLGTTGRYDIAFAVTGIASLGALLGLRRVR